MPSVYRYAASLPQPDTLMRPWTEEQVRTMNDGLLVRNVRALRHALELVRDKSLPSTRPIEDLQHGLGLMEVELIRRGIDHPSLRGIAWDMRKRHEARMRREKSRPPRR